MDRIDTSQGSSTVTLFTITSVLAIIFLGLSFFVRQSLAMENTVKGQADRQKIMVEKAQKVLEALIEDETPHSDCPFDLVWEVVNEDESISFNDISSKFNLNTMIINKDKESGILAFLNKNLVPNKEIFEMPYLEAAKEMKEMRNSEPFIFMDLKTVFSKYINKEYLEDYFTSYSYFNFNQSEQSSMKNLVQIRWESEAEAEDFHRFYKRYDTERINKKSDHKTTEEMEAWFKKTGLGSNNFDEIFPLINAEPQFNVNFLNADIRALILKYYAEVIQPIAKEKNSSSGSGKSFHGIKNWERSNETLGKLIDENEDGLTLKSVHNIIDSNKRLKHPLSGIYQYIGVYTWFWELIIKEKGSQLKWIIVRIPGVKEKDDHEFKVLEEEYIL